MRTLPNSAVISMMAMEKDFENWRAIPFYPKTCFCIQIVRVRFFLKLGAQIMGYPSVLKRVFEYKFPECDFFAGTAHWPLVHQSL